ncbi:hypothetical protein MAPG_10310 [Magnaporthiopsis poae ATCC 64411]|uniref:WSC domain-containing protein n=1 Tax=Magnaporthiopsis poae (strain ATCC 64411 / 73-15) TaxID=644358 RepID=A0A0C4EC96_MAGP6|nr:hypothetical protein MAPG_10310 [Magnaporthiopsis poae ATCC 64411]
MPNAGSQLDLPATDGTSFRTSTLVLLAPEPGIAARAWTPGFGDGWYLCPTRHTPPTGHLGQSLIRPLEVCHCSRHSFSFHCTHHFLLHSFRLPTSVAAMLSKAALLALLAAFAQGNPVRNSVQARQQRCNGDNLLNRFRGAQYTSQALEFCAIFVDGPLVTATITTAAAPIPTDHARDHPTSRFYPSPLFNTRFPMTYMEERLSSACNCIPHLAATRTHTTWVAEVTPTITGSSSRQQHQLQLQLRLRFHFGSQLDVKEPEGKRALQGPSTVAVDMTVAMCADFCKDYTYHGVEYGSECYCGNEVAAGAFPVGSSAECSMLCGGNLRLNLYTASGPAYSAPGRPAAIDVIGAFARKGCFREASGGRILTQGWDSNSMTKEVCLYSCAINGFSHAGMEWGRDCWCDNQMNNAVRLADKLCELPMATPCSGKADAPCGGDVTIEISATT